VCEQLAQGCTRECGDRNLLIAISSPKPLSHQATHGTLPHRLQVLMRVKDKDRRPTGEPHTRHIDTQITGVDEGQRQGQKTHR